MGRGGVDYSDARPSYFPTTCISEPRTLHENDEQVQEPRQEHSKMSETASGHNWGAAGEVDVI